MTVVVRLSSPENRSCWLQLEIEDQKIDVERAIESCTETNGTVHMRKITSGVLKSDGLMYCNLQWTLTPTLYVILHLNIVGEEVTTDQFLHCSSCTLLPMYR